MTTISRSDVSRLLMRVGVGCAIAAHGAQKLFGWFGGGGVDGTAASFESMGFRPGRSAALAAGVAESGGGVLLAVGLATPSAGAATASTMVVAAITQSPRGFFAMKGGFEYPAVLGLASAALALAGAGRLSVDQLLGNRLAGKPLMVLSIAGAAAGTAYVLNRRRRVLAEEAAEQASGS